MRYKVEEIERIGPAHGRKLGEVGIVVADDLLRICGSASGRRAVAAVTGLDQAQLLKWANLADLMRISGVGKQFSELLEAAGVDTIKVLRNRNAENLAAKIRELNAAKHFVRATPSSDQVASWVEQAKGLKPSITH